MYLSPEIREQYKRKINNFILDYRISEYEDDGGYMHNLNESENIRFADVKAVLSCRDLDRSNSKMMVVK